MFCSWLEGLEPDPTHGSAHRLRGADRRLLNPPSPPHTCEALSPDSFMSLPTNLTMRPSFDIVSTPRYETWDGDRFDSRERKDERVVSRSGVDWRGGLESIERGAAKFVTIGGGPPREEHFSSSRT